ncbi:MAG: transglycosylase domain-containing protein, partial [Thermoanaerobaculia bacterium]
CPRLFSGVLRTLDGSRLAPNTVVSARSRLAVLVLAGFVAFGAVAALALAWYGFRVWTEMSPDSWRTATVILDREGETVVELYGGEWRLTEPVLLEDLPEHVPAAFLAAEDVRFRRHPGIDPIGVARAALANVRHGGIAQGGSTITQQLAKMRFLSAERTFTRKAAEAVLALLIEARLSKDEILEAYLNDVYLGHRNGRKIVGVDEAARVYFDTEADELAPAQAAMLAGMIRAPNRDNPEERAKVAHERRDAVLGTMLEREWISDEEHEEATSGRTRFRDGSLSRAAHPYYLAALRAELIERVGARRLRAGGLRVQTALDLDMQEAAEEAVRRGTRRLRNRYRWLRTDEPLQAAILAVDPATGGVRALVGGTDWSESQFDRTRSMRRQPGSALKPFTYAAAIAERRITPATLVEDAPVEIELSRNDVWRPENYDERYRGAVTVREAFEKSLNTPAVRVAQDVGVRRVRNVLDEAGVSGELSDTPAIALGVDEVSMRELLSAYSIFPNLGVRSEPHLVGRVETASGRTIYQWEERGERVIRPAVAYVVHSLMRGVVRRGTASALRHWDLEHVAGKTGTTNDYRDAWFVGYAPDLLAAAWVGFDDGTPLRISSAEAALPVWAAFMADAEHDRGDIEPPEGVSVVTIEPASGLLWAPGCGRRFDEAFLEGTEPEERCRGRVERPPLLVEFEEPPVISPETYEDRVEDAPEIEIVILPRDDDDDPDVLSPEEREEIDRQLEEVLREDDDEQEERPQPREKELERELEKQERELEKRRRELEKELDERAKEIERQMRKDKKG